VQVPSALREAQWLEFQRHGNPDEIPPGHVVGLVSVGSEEDLRRLEWYLSIGGNPNIDDDKGNSLLARAVAGGRVDFVRLLGVCREGRRQGGGLRSEGGGGADREVGVGRCLATGGG
jgi:hypothetical protein